MQSCFNTPCHTYRTQVTNFKGHLIKFIIASNKTSLDIFWLKDKNLTDLDNLPDPDILANVLIENIENIESGLSSFKEIMETLNRTD